MDRELDWVAPVERLAAHSPLVTPSNHTHSYGVPLGRTRTAPFLFDPWHLVNSGIITAAIFMVLGEIGSGKTALNKILGYLFGSMMVDGRRVRVGLDDHKRNDGRPEYEPLVNALGSTERDLSQARLNLLDPKQGMFIGEMLGVLELVVNQIREDQSRGRLSILTETESTMLRAGLEYLGVPEENGTHNPDADYNLRDLLIALNQPEKLTPRIPGTNITMLISEEEKKEAAISMVQVLSRLFGGLYGYMFAGDESLADFMQGDVVAFDYTQLTDQSLVLMQSLQWHWKAANLINLLLCDENHKMQKFEIYRKSMEHYLKVIRMIGGAVIMNSHRISDFEEDANFLGDVKGWFFGRMTQDEPEKMQERFGFDDNIVERLRNLRRGEFIFYIQGFPPVPFRIDLTNFETILTESNSATHRMLDEGSENMFAGAAL